MKLSINKALFLFIVCMFIFTPSSVDAQAHARPNFTGVAIDKVTKQPIKGVWIQMKSEKHGKYRYAKTDENGVYVFKNDGAGNGSLTGLKEDLPSIPNCMLSPNGQPISNFTAQCGTSVSDATQVRYPQCSNCKVYSYDNTAPGIPNGRKIMEKADWGCRSSPFTLTAVASDATINPTQQVLGVNEESNQSGYSECTMPSFMIDNVNDTIDLNNPSDVSRLCKRGEWKSQPDGQGGQVPYLDCYEQYGAETLPVECKAQKKTSLQVISPPPKDAISSSKDIACATALPCATDDVNCSSSTEASVDLKMTRIKLTSLKSIVKEDPSPEKPVYLVQCNRKEQSYDCSTGQAALDSELGLKNSGSVQVKGIFEADGTTPVASAKFTSKLNDSYEWETTVPTSGLTHYSFYIIANGQAVQQNGGVGGQQQGTLSFAGCTEIVDPKGIAFDSYTLEPLGNAEIILSKERKPGTFTRVSTTEIPVGFKNPIKTEADGKFSFFVPDGTYKLQANLKGYSFPYNFTKLNSNFSQLYSNLYKGQPLIQKGEIIQTDIPMDPVDKKASEEFAKNNVAKVISYTQSLNKQENTLTINGRVTHALSSLSLYSKQPSKERSSFERGRLLKQVTADKEGEFNIQINLNVLKAEEVIGEIDVKKHQAFSFDSSRLTQENNPINRITQWISQVFFVNAYETTSTMQIEPLLNYIEGYAKDERGSIISNAKVQVTVPMLKTPLYEVSADAKGYFKIPSDRLPSIEYSLSYISPQKGQIVLNNSTFLTQNTDMMGKNKVNFYAYKYSDGSTRTFVAKDTTSKNDNFNDGQVAGIATSRTMMNYISFILVVMIAATAGLLFVHIHKKKKTIK